MGGGSRAPFSPPPFVPWGACEAERSRVPADTPLPLGLCLKMGRGLH